MSICGIFYGIGVGPGGEGLIPVAAWRALQTCQVIIAPRAESANSSAARECLRGLEIDKDLIREVDFKMNSDRELLRNHYGKLAESIADDLRQGKNVAYLTIGDSFTYSTYSYARAALLEILPSVTHHTFPGVTSYAAVAAAVGWPLGEGKERVLILPCPDNMMELKRDIESHDIVVLMKMGSRLPNVLKLIRELGIEKNCAFASRIGMPDQKIFANLSPLKGDEIQGYLSTMLIRKHPQRNRQT